MSQPFRSVVNLFVIVTVLGWVVPFTPAMAAMCPIHSHMPCCPAPQGASSPAPADPICALHCAQLHATVAVAPSPTETRLIAAVHPAAQHDLRLIAAADTFVTPHTPPPRLSALHTILRC